MNTPPRSAPRIGTVGFDGPRGRTFATLDCIEFQDSFRGTPGDTFLRRLRREAPGGFGFVVCASAAITHAADPRLAKLSLSYLPDGRLPAHPFDTEKAGRTAWHWTLAVAQSLEAEAILLQTPTSFRPTQESSDRITHFAERLGPEAGLPLIWDCQGPWSPEAQRALCTQLGWLPCGDPLLQPLPSGSAYLRVLGRSRSPHGLSANDLDLLADEHLDRPKCWIMLNTPRAHRDAQQVIRRLGRVDST